MGPAVSMTVWFRDLDHHMAVLDADGPSKGCKPDKHASVSTVSR
jgi:hypothetical protein